MKSTIRSLALLGTVLLATASLQGCVLLAAGAGAAGGYEAKKNGYKVQSPVKKDTAGGYKGQSPVKKQDQNSDNQ